MISKKIPEIFAEVTSFVAVVFVSTCIICSSILSLNNFYVSCFLSCLFLLVSLAFVVMAWRDFRALHRSGFPGNKMEKSFSLMGSLSIKISFLFLAMSLLTLLCVTRFTLLEGVRWSFRLFVISVTLHMFPIFCWAISLYLDKVSLAKNRKDQEEVSFLLSVGSMASVPVFVASVFVSNVISIYNAWNFLEPKILNLIAS